MWLPLIMRTALFAFRPATPVKVSLTHGPAAFTMMRALTRSAASPPLGTRSISQRPSRRRALTQRVRVRISAPRSRASRALSTTSLESSTQQSA